MNIKGLILCLTAMGLLVTSVGYSQTVTLKTSSQQNSNRAILNQLFKEISTSSEPSSAKTTNSTPAPTQEITQETAVTSTPPQPKQDNPSKTTISITEQVENSGHYKLFTTLVSKGPSVKDQQGNPFGDSCLRCHSAVKILEDPNAQLYDFLSGGKYGERLEGISCRVCHITENNQMRLRNSDWETCGSCHVNSNGNPVPGTGVNHPQFQMIQGVAIGDILPMPSYKYKYMKDSFMCTDCHMTNSNKHDFMIPGVSATYDNEGLQRTGTKIDYTEFKVILQQESCWVCHSSTAETVNQVKEMQDIISKKIEELKPIYDEWSRKISTMDPNSAEVKAFNMGATYFTFVVSDGSKGVHNFPYALVLLEKAKTYWKELN
jgi:hypothetical protein